jgi:hypothetical protein
MRIVLLFLLIGVCQLTFAQWNPSGTNIYNSNVGNVGVGLTSPDAKFHIKSNNQYYPWAGGFKLEASSSAHTISLNHNSNEGTIWVGSGNSSTGPWTPLKLYIGGTTSMFWAVNGNVGVGNSNPLYKMDVTGSINASQFYVNGTILNQSQWTTSSANIYWNNTGGIGIGTTSPAAGYKLDVTGTKMRIRNVSAPSPAQIEADASGLLTVLESVHTPSAQGRIGTRGSYNFSIFSNDLDRLTVKSDGNVGVGISNPTYKLHVNGSLNVSSLYVNGALVNTGNSSWAGSGANVNFTTGIVSIGTTIAPTGYKLAVRGKVIAEEIDVKLQANWPDYVFESDYTLMPLYSLQKYINHHKHLPGVPSAEVVKEKGISLGEMNATLLKKIEELTLYLLEIKQENDSLKERVERLESKKNDN